MIKVIQMQVGVEELGKAERILKGFSEIVAPMMVEVDELHGGRAKEQGMDIDEIAEDLRACVMIGAAACGMLASAMKEAEEAGGNE